MVNSDRHEDVKITQEHHEYPENEFVDKTIYLWTRSETNISL